MVRIGPFSQQEVCHIKVPVEHSYQQGSGPLRIAKIQVGTIQYQHFDH